jgi:hypothetical protein
MGEDAGTAGRADAPISLHPDVPAAFASGDLDPAALPLWHVRVTLAGPATDAEQLGLALQRLCQASPFLASVRYNSQRAEVTYWDEAEDADDAAALALRVWNDHRRSIGLPPWQVVGLEVVDRDTRRARAVGADDRDVLATGDVRPF